MNDLFIGVTQKTYRSFLIVHGIKSIRTVYIYLYIIFFVDGFWKCYSGYQRITRISVKTFNRNDGYRLIYENLYGNFICARLHVESLSPILAVVYIYI